MLRLCITEPVCLSQLPNITDCAGDVKAYELWDIEQGEL